MYRFRESVDLIRPIYRSKKTIDNTRAIFRSYDPLHESIVDEFSWEQADILDIPSLERVMRGVEQVYHCAGIIEGSFRKLKQINVKGTKNMINVSLHAGVDRFCHVSSIAALGDPLQNKAIDEDDHFNLDGKNTYYAISKFGAEMEAWRATQEGMEVIIVNPGVILGEGNWNYGSSRIFKEIYDGNKFFTAGSSGFIDVRDVVMIMYKLMSSKLMNERFILVAHNRSYKNVLDDIAQSLEKKHPSIKLSKWILQIIAILSFPIRKLGIRGITLRDVDSLTSNTTYSAKKLSHHLEHQFTPIDETIDRVGNYYKKSYSQ